MDWIRRFFKDRIMSKSAPTPAPTGTEYIAPRGIPCITSDMLNDQGNGEVTERVAAVPTCRRDDGTPAQARDVLSLQPDGTMQSRPEGTNGWSERAVVAGPVLVYRPLAGDKFTQTWLVPLTDKWPHAWATIPRAPRPHSHGT